jgi:hypothetical protein
MVTEKSIIEAWAFLRKNNNGIPDDVLDFIKDSSLAALRQQFQAGDIVINGGFYALVLDSPYTKVPIHYLHNDMDDDVNIADLRPVKDPKFASLLYGMRLSTKKK